LASWTYNRARFDPARLDHSSWRGEMFTWRGHGLDIEPQALGHDRIDCTARADETARAKIARADETARSGKARADETSRVRQNSPPHRNHDSGTGG
jgi:hypothetical protein